MDITIVFKKIRCVCKWRVLLKLILVQVKYKLKRNPEEKLEKDEYSRSFTFSSRPFRPIRTLYILAMVSHVGVGVVNHVLLVRV